MIVHVDIWHIRKNHYVLVNSINNDEEAGIIFDHCIWNDRLNDSPKNRRILENMLRNHGADEVAFIEPQGEEE